MIAEHVHLYPLKVQFEDIDLGGVVHHPKYIYFYERARADWMDQKGYPFDHMWKQGYSFVIAEIQIQYLKPARLFDQLFVMSRMVHSNRSTIWVQQALVRQVESWPKPEETWHSPQHFWAEQLKAATPAHCLNQVLLKLVCIDLKTFKPNPFPEGFKKAFT